MIIVIVVVASVQLCKGQTNFQNMCRCNKCTVIKVGFVRLCSAIDSSANLPPACSDKFSNIAKLDAPSLTLSRNTIAGICRAAVAYAFESMAGRCRLCIRNKPS